jgi:hypothetical protein
VRWRLLAVAVAGLAVALPACKFDGPWNTYCGFPGRCATMDGGRSVTQFAQGSTGRSVTLYGDFLGDASVVTTDRSELALVRSWTSERNQISVQLDVPHGVDAGLEFKLNVLWDRPSEAQDTEPFLITHIVVASDGRPDGVGTVERPYATLAAASQAAGPGDTIRVGPGQFASMFPSTASCDDATGGLASGVTVEGASMDASVIVGTGTSGACAFKLSGGGQVVKNLTISGFEEGIRASQDGGLVTGVKIEFCDAGVVVAPNGDLQLQQVTLDSNGSGLVVNGGNVLFEGGYVLHSARTGVWQTGMNGNMVLTGVDAGYNGGMLSSFTDGAGILLEGFQGRATITGGTLDSNAYTHITVSGVNTVVDIDGVTMQGVPNYGLAVRGGNNVAVTLSNSSITNATEGIYVEQFTSFNGGNPVGGGGNTINECTTNIHDARASAASPQMTFARTTVQGVSLDGGTIINSNDTNLRIRVDNGGNQMVFY